MKKLIIIVFALCIGGVNSYAQTAKERQEMQKLSKSELNAKATKAASKAAKQDIKAGWTVAPGHLPLEKQYDRSYLMQSDIDEEGYPKYLTGDATSIGSTYDAAKMQALEMAKIRIAEQMETQIAGLVENSVSNNQLGADEAASVTKTIQSSKSKITQSLGRVIPVVECYRNLKNKNKEVRIVVAYNSKTALEVGKKIIREQLEQENSDLHKKLEDIIGF